MYFTPFVISAETSLPVPVIIEPATPVDLDATRRTPLWQTDWNSAYLSAPEVKKFSVKTFTGELLALGAYRISEKRAYVYILYLESAPHSNPTMQPRASRMYYGIGELLIAFGIKYSIDNGCRGDVVFDAKTAALAEHYERDFHALRLPRGVSDAPARFMLADLDAWRLFSRYLSEDEPNG